MDTSWDKDKSVDYTHVFEKIKTHRILKPMFSMFLCGRTKAS
jgi:hypothetical protein